ncbi:MAG: hypothetical protein J7513_02605 [Solirubrobacteraceae bacterium]|nr:hypothetical protein [Solirubrobacteraceae bacterium]
MPAPVGRPRLRRARRALLLVPALVAAALIAGCFQIIGQTTVQEGDIGDVIVSTDMCLTNGTAGCEAGLSETLKDGDLQYLIGYLVPTWAGEAASITWNGDAGDQVLERNVAYESILQGFAPAPLGTRWVGYASGRRSPPPVGTDQRMRATIRVGVPNDSAPTSLSLGAVTGWRVIRDAQGNKPALTIDRAFNCNESTDGTPTTVCILSGTPQGQPTTPGQTPVFDDIPLSTLVLGAAPAASARAGTTTTIKFPQQSNWSGSGNDTIAMKATTTVPGAKLEAPPAIILGASQLPAEVRVRIPLATDTGDYTVTLATANGLRTSTANLRVTGIRTLIGPQIAAQVKTMKQSVAQLKKYLADTDMDEIRRGNVYDLPIALPGAGTVTGTWKGSTKKGGKKVLLGKDTRTLRAQGTAALHLVTSAAARKVLHSGRSLTGKLTLRFVPKGKKKAETASLSIKLS